MGVCQSNEAPTEVNQTANETTGDTTLNPSDYLCNAKVKIDYDKEDEMIKNSKMRATKCADIHFSKHSNSNSKSKLPKRIRIVHMSDSHESHQQYISDIPKGDIFIHSGDFYNHIRGKKKDKNNNNTNNNDAENKENKEQKEENKEEKKEESLALIETNNLDELNKFMKNIINDKYNFKYKIFVSGNHEERLDNCDKYKICQILFNSSKTIYLENDMINIYNINFFGSPINNSQSNTNGYSLFNRNKYNTLINNIRKDKKNNPNINNNYANSIISGNINIDKQAELEVKESLINEMNDELKRHWKETIPLNTNILITHCPPYGILDLAWIKYNNNTLCQLCNRKHRRFDHWGCKELADCVKNDLKECKVHLFGHVHDENGNKIIGNTLFVNSAMDVEPNIHYFDVFFDL